MQKKTSSISDSYSDSDFDKTPTIETKLYIISNTGEITSKDFLSQEEAL